MFNLARAARQFLDHFVRQVGRRSAPGVGQEIDEEFIGRRNRTDAHLAGQPETDRTAIGIAPRRDDILRRLRGEVLDRHDNRLVEADNQDIAGAVDACFHVVAENKYGPGIAVADIDGHLGSDGLAVVRGGLGGIERGKSEKEEASGQDAEARRPIALSLPAKASTCKSAWKRERRFRGSGRR